jgi:methylase of polypeptide subunit release factors
VLLPSLRTRKRLDEPLACFFTQFAQHHTKIQEHFDLQRTDSQAAGRESNLGASRLLIRLMFLYFLQKRGLLDNDQHYLTRKLHLLLHTAPGSFHSFLHDIYRQLFSDEEPVTPAFQSLTGNLPHLPGITEIAPDENQATLPDDLFAAVLADFDQYHWTLEEPAHEAASNSIHPGLISVLFEKYLHQKSTGSYYTSTDVTAYISANTIIPCLLSKIERHYPQLFAAGGPIVECLRNDPDRYIPEALRHTDLLPAETEREYQARQQHYRALKDTLRNSTTIDLTEITTLNLRLSVLVEDLIRCSQDVYFLQVCYEALSHISILDPTCGSGAFLFAALEILETLYTACLTRIQRLIAQQHHSTSSPEVTMLQDIVERATTFPGRRSFIISTILRHNLYGIDILPEAVEVCQLRFILTLLSMIPCPGDLPPVDDVPIHVFSGNALVGFITPDEAPPSARAYQQHDTVWLDSSYAQRCGIAAEQYENSQQYRQALQDWRDTHRPFHWSAKLPTLMQDGGFDVIIGNPPYIEYSKIKAMYQISEYETESCGNLYAAVTGRALALSKTQKSFIGLVVPLSICGSERFSRLRAKLRACTTHLWLANFEIFPSRLFDNAFQRLSILLALRDTASNQTLHVTRIQRWYAAERSRLMSLLHYTPVHQSEQARVFPKFASSLHEGVIQKIVEQAQGHILADVLSSQPAPHFVFYQEATNYWIKATCYVPYYKKNGTIQTPPHSRMLYVSERPLALTIMAIINSSLFYTWFATYSDGFHLAHSLVKNFPVHPQLYQDEQLQRLAQLLERDIRQHAQKSTRNTRASKDTNKILHSIELEEYHMGRSKALLDQIDTVLAKYYHLNAQELDFVMNYDIKYRIGK